LFLDERACDKKYTPYLETLFGLGTIAIRDRRKKEKKRVMLGISERTYQG